MCFKAREELMTRKIEWSERRGVREGEVTVIEGSSGEKDRRLIGRDFHRREEELRKGRSD